MMGRKFTVIILVLLISSAAFPGAADHSGGSSAFDRYFRTELFFGMDKPTGREVTAEEWDKFLADEVTPRFPDGLTVFAAAGQFRSATGAIVREKSRVIILLYSKKDRATASRKIDEIRAAYCKKFDQESVMRIDYRRSVEVSF